MLTPTIVVAVMFNISTKIDYSLLIALELARHSGGDYISLHDIAEHHSVSIKYLSNIITPLKQAGLVESKEGKTGGYKLTRNPASISIKDVVEASDGPLELVRCMDTASRCPVESTCGTKPVWHSLKKDVYEILNRKTLQDLL